VSSQTTSSYSTAYQSPRFHGEQNEELTPSRTAKDKIVGTPTKQHVRLRGTIILNLDDGSVRVEGLLSRISAIVRNRNLFLSIVTTVSMAKLILSAIEPASFDIRDIIGLASSSRNPVGPWIALYPPLYSQFTNSTQIQAWLLTPPSSIGTMLLISLAFRLPVFVFDLAIAVIVYCTAKKLSSPIEGRIATLIWFANPFSLFCIELLGVPDVVATLLILLAFGLLLSQRPILSGIAIGLGVWVKLFPILLIPPFLLYVHMNGFSRKNQSIILCVGLLGLVGYLSSILPFGSYYMTLYTPVTQPMPFFAGVSAVNGSAFVLILFYCLLGLFVRRGENLLSLLIPTLMIYFAVSNPYPQYLMWALPLVAIDIVLVKRSRAILFVAFNTLAFAQWFFTSSGFLTPSGYSLLMIPLGGDMLPWYSRVVTTLLESYSSILLLPLVSSGFYACTLIYAADVARSWFESSSGKA